VDQPTNTNKYLLHVLNGPITRFKINALKEPLNRLVLQVLANAEIRDPLEHQKEALIHLINLLIAYLNVVASEAKKRKKKFIKYIN
jgi:hypothetical protein